jgi:ABC-2 type transport system ATP-binding protein
LILDEPTIGLDPEQVVEIRKLIRDLGAERTVILSTHILSEVSSVCDRVIIINQGRILAVDSTPNLNQRLRQTSQIYVEVRGPAAAVAERLQSVPGVLSIEPAPAPLDGAVAFTVSTEKHRDLRAQLAACITGAQWELQELRPVALSLEAIFLSLISEPARMAPAVDHEVPRRLPA